MPPRDNEPGSVDLLAAQLGCEWQNLVQARKTTQDKFNDLKHDLDGLDNLDSSIVVFGSLARNEATHASDIDWTLLIDGKADPQHIRMAHEIRRRISVKKPGREDTFGKQAFSHEIVNFIGGGDARSIRYDFGEALKDIFLKIRSPVQQLMIERGIF